MKLFNLAIASIVDANTGNGINNRFIDQFASATSDYEHRGREIRAKSLLAAIGKIRDSISQYIEDSKARARDHKNVNEVLRMNDHLLKDIGLNQGDILDLRWGQTSLEALNTRRELNRIEATGQLLSQGSNSVSAEVRNIGTANQEIYESRKCA